MFDTNVQLSNEASPGWAFIAQQLGVPVATWVVWLLVPNTPEAGFWHFLYCLVGLPLALLIRVTQPDWAGVGMWIWVAPTLVLLWDIESRNGTVRNWLSVVLSGRDPVGTLVRVPILACEVYSFSLFVVDRWMSSTKKGVTP